MPTKRQRLVRNPRADIPPELFALFRDQPLPEHGNVFTFKFTPEDELFALWAEHGDGIVSEWCEKKPGTRPNVWWSFSAPRQPIGRFPGWYYDGKLCEPRLRLGGKGTPAHEVLAYVHHFVLGIPDHWIDDWSLDYYNGRALDVHGKPIDTEYHEGDFIAERFDPSDPPRFESQASYLRRNKLLHEREGARLKAAAFEAETLPQELWPE